MNREAYELLLERLGLGDWTQETCSEVWRQFCAAYSSRVERSRADVPGADVVTKASPAAPFGPASDGTSGASDVSGDTSDDENTEEVWCCHGAAATQSSFADEVTWCVIPPAAGIRY